MDTLVAILDRQPPPASKFNSKVTPELQEVLDRCLRKDPADRYESARELATPLAECKIRIDSEQLRPTVTSNAVHRAPRRRRVWARPLVLAPVTAAVIVLSALWIADVFIKPTPPPPNGSGNVVAVLPFTVRGDEQYAYLADGMVDLLSTKLDGAGELRSIVPRTLRVALDQQGGGELDPDRARAVAEQVGAGLFVLGDILASGETLHMNAFLYETAGAGSAAMQTSVQGHGDDVLALVDQIAANLLADKLVGSQGGYARIANTTTESLPALKEFLTGESHFRVGQYSLAVESYKRAVAEDSTFALAWYRLGRTLGFSLKVEYTGPDATTKALEYRDRLPPRVRMAAEGHHAAWDLHDPQEGLRLLRGVVAKYPDDVEASVELGELLFLYGKRMGLYMEEARQVLNQALTYDPGNVDLVAATQWLVGTERKDEECTALGQRRLELAPDGDFAPGLRVELAFTSGDSVAKQSTLDELRQSGNIGWWLWGMLHAYHGNIDGAVEILKLASEPTRAPNSRAQAYRDMGYLDLARGRWSDAKRNLSRAQQLNPIEAYHLGILSLHPLLAPSGSDLEKLSEEIAGIEGNAVWARILSAYLLGHLEARGARPAAALEHASALDSLRLTLEAEDEQPNLRIMARELAHSVRAEMELRRGLASDALHEIEKVQPESLWFRANPNLLFCMTYERYTRAMLLEMAGQHREALRWYGTIGADIVDTVYMAPKHLRMAEIYDELGEYENAVLHYGRFVELWQNCDPEFRPLVEEARQALIAAESKLSSQVN